MTQLIGPIAGRGARRLAAIERKLAEAHQRHRDLQSEAAEAQRLRRTVLALTEEELRLAQATGASAATIRRLRREINLLRGKTVEVRIALDIAGAVEELGADFAGKSGGPNVRRTLRDRVGGAIERWATANKGLLTQGVMGRPGTARGTLGTLERLGHRMGLVTTSGYRPGDPGWHGRNRARDLSGPPRRMMAFARRMYTQFGGRLLELIYTPMGVGIDNGRSVNIRRFFGPKVASDHYDHVHVAARHGRRTSHRATKPTVHFAEEAPRHPEYYISTNPRDRRRSVNLLAQAAAEISGSRLAHFQRGGRTGMVVRSLRRAGLRGRMLELLAPRRWPSRAGSSSGGMVGRRGRRSRFTCRRGTGRRTTSPVGSTSEAGRVRRRRRSTCCERAALTIGRCTATAAISVSCRRCGLRSGVKDGAPDALGVAGKMLGSVSDRQPGGSVTTSLSSSPAPRTPSPARTSPAAASTMLPPASVD